MTFKLLRPHITLSVEDVPLTVDASDLFPWSFPYERLPLDAPMIAFFMKPMTPILLITAYFITEKLILPQICRSLKVEGTSLFWKCVFALHNFSLAVFSLVVFVNSWVSVSGTIFIAGCSCSSFYGENAY